MSPTESRRYNGCSGSCFTDNLRSLRAADDHIAFEQGARSALLKSCLVGLIFTPCVLSVLLLLPEDKKDDTKG